MKILIFTENIYRGGLDSFLVHLINHWPIEKDEIYLICNNSHPGLEDIKQSINRPCRIIPHKIPIYFDINRNSKKYYLLSFLKYLPFLLIRYNLIIYYIISIRSLFLKLNPDRLIVVNGGHPGGDTCRASLLSWSIFMRHRPKAIYNFHNLPVPLRWKEKLPEKLFDILLIRNANLIIGVSQACILSFKKRIKINNLRNFLWIYNGLPTPILENRPTSLRKELNIPENTLICIMLATYEPRKGHDFLLEAFKIVASKIPLSRLLVCGHGYPEQLKNVESLVVKLNLSNYVFLHGYRRDIDFLIDQSDLLLVSSQAYESFGLTSVEAMARKTPVVATRVGGIPEVVENGEGGFCVDPTDVEGYAQLIITLLKDPELRKDQGEKGFRRYQRMFTADRMAKQYADLIRSENPFFDGTLRKIVPDPEIRGTLTD